MGYANPTEVGKKGIIVYRRAVMKPMGDSGKIQQVGRRKGLGQAAYVVKARQAGAQLHNLQRAGKGCWDRTWQGRQGKVFLCACHGRRYGHQEGTGSMEKEQDVVGRGNI